MPAVRAEKSPKEIQPVQPTKQRKSGISITERFEKVP